MVFLQLSKVHVPKNSNNHMIEPFLKKFITTFIIDVSHLSGEIFSTIEIRTQNLSFSHRKKYFDGIAYLEFSTAKMISY